MHISIWNNLDTLKGKYHNDSQNRSLEAALWISDLKKETY